VKKDPLLVPCAIGGEGDKKKTAPSRQGEKRRGAFTAKTFKGKRKDEPDFLYPVMVMGGKWRNVILSMKGEKEKQEEIVAKREKKGKGKNFTLPTAQESCEKGLSLGVLKGGGEGGGGGDARIGDPKTQGVTR